MHICLMTRSCLQHGVAGGMERHAADLAGGLAAWGHRITIITTRHPQGKAEILASDIRTIFIPHTSERAYSAAWWREGDIALSRLHRADPVDLIWSQSIGAYGYLRRRASERTILCVTILHGTPLGEWRAMRRQWGFSVGHLPKLARFGLRTLLYQRKFYVTSRHSDRLICVSPQLAEDAVREFGVRSEIVKIIPNGVNTAKFAPHEAMRQLLRSRLGIPEDAIVLLTAGRLEQAKGHHLALQAAARLLRSGFSLQVLVAGSGPDEVWLRQQAESLGIAERVHWLGQTPHSEMPGVYNAVDVVLMLSIHTEAFPYSVVEAMACGRAVVASRVGGVPSAIVHGREGFLVAPGDVAEAAAHAEALIRDSALRATVGRAARQTVLNRFTLEQMVSATDDVFRGHSLVGEAKP